MNDSIDLAKNALVSFITLLIDDQAVPVQCDVLHKLDGLHVFIVHIPKGQIGKVVGKNGRMARALRQILQAGAVQNRLRFALDLQEAPCD